MRREVKPGSQGGLWRFFRPDGSRQAGGGVGGEEGEGHSSHDWEQRTMLPARIPWINTMT